MSYQKTLRKHLFALRILKNLTKAEVAKAVGVDENTVSLWERGTQEPTLQQLSDLADILDVTVGFLLGQTN